jgi:hypothetical protein
MNKLWQDYTINKDDTSIDIKCNISIYEDIDTLSFSYPFLVVLESSSDELAMKLTDNDRYVYVGYRVFDGVFSLYIYLSKEEDVNAFDGHTYRLEEDHGWQMYYKYLYPTMEQWQSIENSLLCDKVENYNEEILKHKLTFQSEFKKASLIEDLEEEGFEIEEEFVNSEGYNGLYFSRKDMVGLENLDKLTIYLKQFLKIYDALYEGWKVR